MIMWSSSSCPVSLGTIVEVKFKDRSCADPTVGKAGLYAWEEVEQYRVVDDDGKQPRYKNNDGSDWIDECAAEFTPEEFRGAMKFTIGKYLKRLGKKDSIEMELGKIADYAARWVEVEKSR